MENYPLTKMNKEGTLLHPQHSYYSDEYAQRMCNLYLSDSIVKDEQGNLHKYYRLHAKHEHSLEMAFAYDILCPQCKVTKLKQIGSQLTYNELGLYKCPVCDRK